MSTPVRKRELPPALSLAAPPISTSPLRLLAPLLVGIFSAGYALLFGWLSLRRYWGYQMHALDMGNMGQAAWNTLHGHPYFFTNVRLPWNIEAWNTTTRLSFHVEPIFPVISLSYLVYPAPETLIVLQTVALALGAVPVYFLAIDLLRSRLLGIAFAAAYLLFPTLEGMNLYEFHPVALATPLLLAAFLFAYRRQHVPFLVCALLAMGTKEEMGLVVALLGVYVAVFLGERKTGVPLAAFGVFWSLFAVLVIEHHYRQPGTVTYFHSRYGYLGHGLHGSVDTILHNPGAIGNALFIWPKAAYIRLLLVPVGFLALLAPEILLIAAPTLALNLLSTEFHMFSGVGQDSAEIISVVMVAAVVGTRRLLHVLEGRFSRSRARLLVTAYIAVAALWTQHSFGYTPAGAEYSLAPIGAHQRVEDRFVAMVPSGAPVATQDQLDPHLSSRHYLYLFSDTGRQPPLAPANDVLLDVSTSPYAHPPADIYRSAMSLLHGGWGVLAADDGLIYLRKGVSRKSIPPSFYRYEEADGRRPQHSASGVQHGLELRGYDVERTDQPNHRIPNLQYTIYLRAQRKVQRNFSPVIFEVVHGKSLACVTPTGLDWLPTSRWTPDRLYRVDMQTLETGATSPGTARLELAVMPTPTADCGALWASRGQLTHVGNLTISW
jgi:uncharacterized membrane protein